jgi:hypothetical protein
VTDIRTFRDLECFGVFAMTAKRVHFEDDVLAILPAMVTHRAVERNSVPSRFCSALRVLFALGGRGTLPCIEDRRETGTHITNAVIALVSQSMQAL